MTIATMGLRMKNFDMLSSRPRLLSAVAFCSRRRMWRDRCAITQLLQIVYDHLGTWA